MEHYEKGETVEVEADENPFDGLKGISLSNVVTMRVKHGSKVRNLMGFAMRKIKEDTTKHIIFAGSGLAVSKTITCVEIMKRRIKTLHQISKIYFKRIEEYWEPKEEGLDRLKVNRHIPAISVLLSKEELDASESGYQAPGSYDALWAEHACQEKAKSQTQSATKRKHKDKPQGTPTTKTSAKSNQKKPPRRKNKTGGEQNSEKGRKEERKGESSPRQLGQQQQRQQQQ